MKLPHSLAAWNTADFSKALQQEIEQTDPHALPLNAAMVHGSHLGSRPIQAMLLHSGEQGDTIHAKVGIFYTSIIAGCNCSDDPTPVDENAEYCELLLHIDRQTAETKVQLISD